MTVRFWESSLYLVTGTFCVSLLDEPSVKILKSRDFPCWGRRTGKHGAGVGKFKILTHSDKVERFLLDMKSTTNGCGYQTGKLYRELIQRRQTCERRPYNSTKSVKACTARPTAGRAAKILTPRRASRSGKIAFVPLLGVTYVRMLFVRHDSQDLCKLESR